MGAREILLRADTLINQLIGYGMRAELDDRKFLDHPRKIRIDFNQALGQVDLAITPKIEEAGGKLVDQSSYKISVAFDPLSNSFKRPPEVTFDPPPSTNRVQVVDPKEEIVNARFPEFSEKANGLAEAINQTVYGQEEFARYIEEDMNRYLVAESASLREPKGSILVGFPGVGKSTMVDVISDTFVSSRR